MKKKQFIVLDGSKTGIATIEVIGRGISLQSHPDKIVEITGETREILKNPERFRFDKGTLIKLEKKEPQRDKDKV